jgi:hypothetical protein
MEKKPDSVMRHGRWGVVSLALGLVGGGDLLIAWFRWSGVVNGAGVPSALIAFFLTVVAGVCLWLCARAFLYHRLHRPGPVSLSDALLSLSDPHRSG